jgi:choline dehydrogenase-like flavoprotein
MRLPRITSECFTRNNGHHEPFDAIIVGSGATGGWVSKELSQAGMRVAVLEAGPTTHLSDFRGAPPEASEDSRVTLPSLDHRIQSNCYACRTPINRWFVDDTANPYVQTRPFAWIRMRALGGRTIGWEGHSYRLSDIDFKATDLDGYGDNWPISYSALNEYYDTVEKYLKISGHAEGFPQIPDGVFCSPDKQNLSISLLNSKTSAILNTKITSARLARSTRGYFSLEGTEGTEVVTPWAPLADAAATKNVSFFTGAAVARVLAESGLATGVEFIDKSTMDQRVLRGRLVLLCASTLESTRILLNSELARASDVLGKYLMDHVFGAGATGIAYVSSREFSNGDDQAHRGYIPRRHNLSQKSRGNFLRGYGIQTKIVPAPEVDQKAYTKSSGKIPVRVNLAAFGECLARKENFVELDRATKDAYGIPILKIRSSWCKNEVDLCEDASAVAREVLESVGAESISSVTQPSIPGLSIHEVGTARMGDNPRTSVVNQYCQSHEIPNLFIVDGSVWVSSGCQNPTLTMLALAARCCDYIIHEFGKSIPW